MLYFAAYNTHQILLPPPEFRPVSLVTRLPPVVLCIVILQFTIWDLYKSSVTTAKYRLGSAGPASHRLQSFCENTKNKWVSRYNWNIIADICKLAVSEPCLQEIRFSCHYVRTQIKKKNKRKSSVMILEFINNKQFNCFEVFTIRMLLRPKSY